MAGLNGKGPENKGSEIGRGLGKCKVEKNDESKSSYHLGQGMGKRRKAGMPE